MRKIVVASIKGGVGKTTVSSNLAHSLKRLGFSVGYLDADITAPTGSEAFGMKKPPTWNWMPWPMAARGRLSPIRWTAFSLSPSPHISGKPQRCCGMKRQR